MQNVLIVEVQFVVMFQTDARNLKFIHITTL